MVIDTKKKILSLRTGLNKYLKQVVLTMECFIHLFDLIVMKFGNSDFLFNDKDKVSDKSLYDAIMNNNDALANYVSKSILKQMDYYHQMMVKRSMTMVHVRLQKI